MKQFLYLMRQLKDRYKHAIKHNMATIDVVIDWDYIHDEPIEILTLVLTP